MWVTWEGKDYAEVVAQDWVDSAKYFMTRPTPRLRRISSTTS